MKRVVFSLLLVAMLVSLNSCSGLPGGNSGGGGSGNANVSLAILDTPPAGIDFLSFNLPIIGITLTPQSGGTPVNLFSTISVFDLVHLQSDSAFLGTIEVPADTYNKMTITLGTPSTIIANGNSSQVGNCAANTICTLNGGTPGSIDVTLSPALVLTGGSTTGLGVDFNLNNIVITTNTGAASFDFTQPNAITAVSLPRAGQATGTITSIEDFTGTLTASSTSSITVTSKTRGTLAGGIGSSTTYTGISTTCGGNPNAQCLGIGKTVSVDGTIGADGSVSITEVDFLDDPAVDEIEGIIYNTTDPNKFGMIVSDVVNATNNSSLNNVGSGFSLFFTLDPAATFAVDSRNLPAVVTTGFNAQSDLVSGQQVMIRVETAGVNGTEFDVLTDRLVLRYSRLTGTVNSVSGNVFSLQTLPPFLGTFTGSPQVLTFPGVTVFDNASVITDLSSGDSVSFRALYLNPNAVSQPFLAAKVRDNSTTAAAIAAKRAAKR